MSMSIHGVDHMSGEEIPDPFLRYVSERIIEYGSGGTSGVEKREIPGVLIATEEGLVFKGDDVNSSFIRQLGMRLIKMADSADGLSKGTDGEVRVNSSEHNMVRGYVVPYPDDPDEDHDGFMAWLEMNVERPISLDVVSLGDVTLTHYIDDGDYISPGMVIMADEFNQDDAFVLAPSGQLVTGQLITVETGIGLESLLVARDHIRASRLSSDEMIRLSQDESLSDEVRDAFMDLRRGIVTASMGRFTSMREWVLLPDRDLILAEMASSLGEERPAEPDSVLGEIIQILMMSRGEPLGVADFILEASGSLDLSGDDVIDALGHLVEIGLAKPSEDGSSWTLSDERGTYELRDGTEVMIVPEGESDPIADHLSNLIEQFREMEKSVRETGSINSHPDVDYAQDAINQIFESQPEQLYFYLHFLDTYPWLGDFAPSMWLYAPPVIDPGGLAGPPPEGWEIVDYLGALQSPTESLLRWCYECRNWEEVSEVVPEDWETWRSIILQNSIYARREQ